MAIAVNSWRRKLGALATAVTAAGGLLLVAPAAHAASSSCSGRGYLEVDFSNGGSMCDLSHASHRLPIDECGVSEIDAGNNWVAIWAGPSMSQLKYYTVSPWGKFIPGGGTWFCVGDIAINP